MIKVGDKVFLDGVEYFVNDIRSGSVSLYKGKNPLSVMFMNEKTLYVKLYEQQKQRADELEQKLNKEVEESYQMENRWRTEIERADELENRWGKLKEILDKVWKYGDADEHEIAYDLLNRMKQLQEPNDD